MLGFLRGAIPTSATLSEYELARTRRRYGTTPGSVTYVRPSHRNSSSAITSEETVTTNRWHGNRCASYRTGAPNISHDWANNVRQRKRPNAAL